MPVSRFLFLLLFRARRSRCPVYTKGKALRSQVLSAISTIPCNLGCIFPRSLHKRGCRPCIKDRNCLQKRGLPVSATLRFQKYTGSVSLQSYPNRFPAYQHGYGYGYPACNVPIPQFSEPVARGIPDNGTQPLQAAHICCILRRPAAGRPAADRVHSLGHGKI